MKKTTLYLLLIISFLSLAPRTLVAQDLPAFSKNTEALVDKVFGDKPELYFTFQLTDREAMHQLTRIISVDQVKGGEVWAYSNKKQFREFLKLGIPYTVLPPPSSEFKDETVDQVNTKLPLAWDFYPSYTAYENMMYQFSTSHPDICQIIEIGTLSSGRKLLAAKISSYVDSAMNKPQFLYSSSIHGDELTCYVNMLRLIDYLLSNYGTDPRITNMVNSIEIYICPLANPDGTYYGGNTNVNAAIRGNANVVDLNRNYPDPQTGPHPDGNAWQQETVHFMNFANEHHFVLGGNFHGGAEVMNYPWDTWATLTADDSWWYFVSREFADTVHEYSPATYMNDLDNGVTNGYAWYEIDGGRQDYMNWFHKCREETIEVSNTKKPSGANLPTYWTYLNHSFFLFMEQCLYGIRGIVTDSITGAPLRAKVFIQGHDFDSSHVYSALPVGNYHRLLYQGNYNLTFSCPGYYPKTISNLAVAHYYTLVQDVQLVSISSGIDAIENEGYTVYPNPCNDLLYINYVGQSRIYGVELYNTLGDRLWIEDFGKTPRERCQYDVSGLPSGIYFLKVRTERGGSEMKKLLVK